MRAAKKTAADFHPRPFVFARRERRYIMPSTRGSQSESSGT
jgi:hypothetical protein